MGRLPTIEGERVSLRWLEAADMPALFEIFGDARVPAMMGIAPRRDQALPPAGCV